MKMFGLTIKAEKKDAPAKMGSATSPAYQDPVPDEGVYKAYIPNFLYKPPFGYPLNKNVLHLKALAKNPFIFSIIRTLKDEASTCKWEIRYKKEFAKEAFSKQDVKKKTSIDKGLKADGPNGQTGGRWVTHAGKHIYIGAKWDKSTGIEEQVLDRINKFRENNKNSSIRAVVNKEKDKYVLSVMGSYIDTDSSGGAIGSMGKQTFLDVTYSQEHNAIRNKEAINKRGRQDDEDSYKGDDVEAKKRRGELKATDLNSETDVKAGEGEIQRISNWFYNPNANDESFSDIIGQWVQDLCECDAAVGVKVFDKKDNFLHVYARDGSSFLKNCDIYGSIGNRDEIIYPYSDINPNLTTPYNIKIYSAAYAETAAYYQYGWTGNALPVPFGKREIIYLSSNTRTDSIYGRSPLEVIEEVLLTLIYGVLYNTDFYLNGNAPDGLINLVGADQEIAKAFQDRLKDKFKTADNLLGNSRRVGHQYPVYGGPAASFVPFQLSSKDMEIIEQQKWFTKLVWSAFGVTPDEMGYTEDSNKAVSQTQTAVSKRKSLKPMLKKIEYAINSQIMPELDPSGKFEFAFEDYDIQEELMKAQLYQTQITGGWKTAEMVAEEEGIDLGKLQAHKEEEAQKEMAMAKETNPGFLPEPKPSAKALLKAEYLKMDLDELIAEHQKLVSILEKDNPEEVQQELTKQKEELQKYLEQKQPYATNDVVKVMSASNSHVGKIGKIGRIFNNGTENYYEVILNDGFELLFAENMKKLRDGNFNFAEKLMTDDTQVPLSSAVKADKDDISLYFEKVRKHLIEKIEREE